MMEQKSKSGIALLFLTMKAVSRFLHFQEIFPNFQVEVDMEYHKQLLTLHLRQNPKEVLIGWYPSLLQPLLSVGMQPHRNSIPSLLSFKISTTVAKEELSL